MKLIIDIAEENYNNIEPFLNGQQIKGGFNLFKVLEMIKNGVPFDDMPFNEVKIDTLRLERYYSRELILGSLDNNGSYLRRAIADGFADCLTNNLDKYVNYVIEHCPDLDRYHFVGEVKVLERK